ncbi:hypothetical protein Hanom_Chr07g00654221 [Helianthus anomalus]
MMEMMNGVGTSMQVCKASGYGDVPSLEDDPPRRRHVIVLSRMDHPPKLEGMRGWS